MRRVAFGFLLLAMSTAANAGYDEFAILDFQACKQYRLTSDWGDTEFRSKEARRQFDRDRANAGFGPDRPIFAMYGEPNEAPSFAGCDYQETHVECRRIGNFPYAVLKCPFGKTRSQPWVRTCQVNSVSVNVRMYWVDTGEHEDGSDLVNNSFLDADFKRFSAKCGQTR